MVWHPKQEMEKLKIKTGPRPAKVVDAFEGTSRAGNKMTTLVFQTTDDGARETIYDHFVEGELVAVRRMMAFLKAIGLADEETVEPEDLVGKELLLVVSSEKYEGMPQSKIKGFRALNSKGVKESK